MKNKMNTQLIKKSIATIILSTLACSAFATGELMTNGTQISVKTLAAKKIQAALMLTPIKEAIPSLVVFGIKDTQIGNYKSINSNAGMLFVDDSGNILMSGQKVMLINYKGSDLSNIDGIKKVIEESTDYKITEYNQDGGLYYFKAGSITIIAESDIAETPYALMGAFTTTQQLLKLKNQVVDQTKEVMKSKPLEKAEIPKLSAEASPQNTQSDKTQGIQKALAYIETHYPDNLVHYKADTSSTKATLIVFTDYSCAHCKDLHKQLPNLLKQGFDVNYILMPRADITSTVAQNMQKVLCAESPKEATEYLYQNQRLPHNLKERENCPVNIKDNLSFATGFSVTGTPTIIASNGKVTSGFSSVYGILEKLNLAQN